MDDKQLFRQYDLFNQDTLLDYLEEIKKRQRKVILFIDRTPQHRSKKVTEYLEKNTDTSRVV